MFDAPPGIILERLADWLGSGLASALITIVSCKGRTSRSVGTIMAIAEDGRRAGSISGGCFDASITTEAVEAISDRMPRILRLGQGSPWIDIRLPCGGGLELLILPGPDFGTLTAMIACLRARRPVSVEFSVEHGIRIAEPIQETSWDGRICRRLLQPPVRLLAFGSGGEVVSLAKLARSAGLDVTIGSPDRCVLDALGDAGNGILLKSPDSPLDIACDARTAVAFFFHDHDWEPPLIEQALRSPAFFVGAMGSRTAQAQRLQTLRARGVSEAALDRLVCPIGLFGPARDPRSLAVSALAQIFQIAGEG